MLEKYAMAYQRAIRMADGTAVITAHTPVSAQEHRKLYFFVT